MKRILMAVIGIAIVLATVILGGSVLARDITSDANPRIEYRLTGATSSTESEDSEAHSYFTNLSVDTTAKWIEEQEENSRSAEEVIREYNKTETQRNGDSPSEADAQ